ncbi:conserved hypothetical protein [Culex quinquefasciatus]|uniref:G-protein coupled receptors family 2 profile 2 domain-containing protein n=1 Tax=Culex quinquefasciatus TaxID=7176 RepID=B0X3X3_CULQU|nr:conserved hypothetical protein [Culex quinquefasciatus]|eukprot:XP_001864345.1 conserved hypothetical protein [Culex quinquefasciatus]
MSGSIIRPIIANITSIVFMLLTLIIYLCIPELRNVHGKCFICYVFSMLCSYTLLVFTKLDYKLYYCYYYQYFWIMAGFFWLNVLCFDIFWTFSSGVVKRDERKRFLKYSLYAWGCPMILLGLIVLIENTSFVPEDFRPQIAADHCYFGGLTAAAIYLYSLMTVLVLVNISFFVMTAIRILRVQRATDVALQHGSRRHSSVEDRYRIHLYLRLFVVMGVSWIFEVASFIACPEGSCNDTAMLLYYVLPVSVLMLAGFSLLVKTKLRINQFARQPQDTIRTDTKLDHERFFLTVLISVVLALSFALNVLSWAFPDNHVLYFLSSVSFYVVGVVIFFLFICNRHVDQWCGRSR